MVRRPLYKIIMKMNMQLAITGELAQIYMKDGRYFFGILLNDLETSDVIEDEIRYVRPSNLSDWLETADEGLVQVVETDHVDGIDLYLK